ncbi:MAG: hypothetical protein ACE14V_09535 [bacterium]
MQIIYLILMLVGFGLTSYGFWLVVDEIQTEKKSVWKSFCLLIGLIGMVFGILLYGVPHFFSSH